MALLAVARLLSGELGLRVGACWVDHGIRPEAELAAEREFVLEACARLGVPLDLRELPRGSVLAAAGSRGVEDAARRARYRALEAARAEGGWELILTAHTSDDVLETMVMRVFSGSGAAGLRGIPERSGRVGRPFLRVRKSELLDWLASAGMGYRLDSTNESGQYLRNRVRRELLPVMESVFPGWRTALEALSVKSADDEEALSAAAGELAASGGIPIPAFTAAPAAVRERALFLLADAVAGGDGGERIPWRLVRQAASCPPEPGRARILASGAGLRFLSDGARILVRAEPESGPPAGRASGFSFAVSGPGTYRIATDSSLEVYYGDDGLRLDAFSWPLVLRSRLPGDSIAGAGGGKRVDDLLKELGIPPGERDSVPVAEDRDGLVAVLGSLHGKRDIYRRNDGIKGVLAPGYLSMKRKGLDRDYAVRR